MMLIINDDYDTFICRLRVISFTRILRFNSHTDFNIYQRCYRAKFLVEIPFYISATREYRIYCVYTCGCVYYSARSGMRGAGGSEHLSPGANPRLLLGCHTPSAFIIRRYVPTVQTGNSGRVRCHTTRQIGGDDRRRYDRRGNTLR